MQKVLKRWEPITQATGLLGPLQQQSYKVLQAFYRDFCPFIQQGLPELTKILGRVVHSGDCTAQFILNMFYGVAVWRSCRLLRLDDVALLKEIKDYPSMVRCGVIVLVVVVAAWQMALSCFAKCPSRAHRWGTCHGASDVIWHHCE